MAGRSAGAGETGRREVCGWMGCKPLGGAAASDTGGPAAAAAGTVRKLGCPLDRAAAAAAGGDWRAMRAAGGSS